MMGLFLKRLASFKLQLLSLLVAIGLWMFVHGQGQGYLTLEVPLQVRGLSADLVLVNDLPDRVKITVSGWQRRLREFQSRSFFIPVDVSDISSPGVIHRTIQVSTIPLPSGLRIEKIRPDRLELQVDRKILRKVRIHPVFELPAGWRARDVRVEPAKIELTGPEVWLGAMPEVQTNPIRLKKLGAFRVQVAVASPSGKGIQLVNPDQQVIVIGELVQQQRRNEDNGEEG